MEEKSQIWRHIKTGGLYTLFTNAELESDLSNVVVYISMIDGRTWVRPSSEFYDTDRFENLSVNQLKELI